VLAMNKKILFNDGWEFAKTGLDTSDWAGLAFQPVDVPHDWLIYNTQDLYENSIGWYRKRFIYSGEARHVLLYFEGVYMDSSLYVNGSLVGEWKYGYSSFEHEITSALTWGENEILLKVVHQGPNSRWYSGAGLYRNVWLKTRSDNYILTDGIYICTQMLELGWEVEVTTEISASDDLMIVHSIQNEAQILASASKKVASSGNIAARAHIRMTANNPLLWSTENPQLYQLITQLYKDGELIESVAQNIGFRDVRMDPEQGLIVNGQHMKLNGTCEHHDLGALGAAFNKEAMRRRLKLLKEMGVNAIRTAHNMPAPEVMDLADEMGFFVVSEVFDMWERSKTPYDYARFFKAWVYQDVRSWIRRDRNHPSLLMWSIGNEIYDTHADDRGQEITRMLMQYVLEHDPKGNGRITIGSNYMPWENAQRCADIVKVAGYNYAEKYYHLHHSQHPDWIIYGSETASVVQSRGIYHFPYEKSILTDDNEQCSALGNSRTSWGAKSVEACIIDDRDAPFSLGQFIWTGFDYIGEPTPYHTKNSFFGQLDTATFPKDSFYMYQAAWTDYRTNPMVHLFPYWDFNEGQLIDIRVYSNAPRIELQLNGSTIGTQHIDHKHGTQLSGWWKVPYTKGVLKAIAYDTEGSVIAVDEKRSFEDAAQICLQPDKETLFANGRDVVYLEISMKDSSGIPVENASNRVHVSVSGAGRLIGLDNGDSTDYDPYKGTSRRLFSGKLIAIIQASLEPGKVRVEVSSRGLAPQHLELQVLPSKEKIEGLSANEKNRELPCVTGALDEVPLRKIELTCVGGRQLGPDRKEIIVKARLCPAHASYQDLEWGVQDDLGNPSNLARIEAHGHQSRITALGDGEFRVRCTSKNGTNKTRLISQLEFQAAGLGTVYKNPYQFIAGGAYDYCRGEAGNGNDRGVSTSRDGETQVGYRDIDFGPRGSDTITIPIFALTSEEYQLQIWEGMPEEEGASLLVDAVYQKESKWNVYQEETYRLSKKLRGISSICFVLKNKVHIKGFTFQKQNQAYEQHHAVDCNLIYGDSYQIADQSIEGIGNNVTLEFQELDFGSEGAVKLVICGRTPIDKNTIQLRFAHETGETTQLVEFTKCNTYELREFAIEKVTGQCHVTFIFLPGSSFDFKWFRFAR
jgi:beta-galactosidase